MGCCPQQGESDIYSVNINAICYGTTYPCRHSVHIMFANGDSIFHPILSSEEILHNYRQYLSEKDRKHLSGEMDDYPKREYSLRS